MNKLLAKATVIALVYDRSFCYTWGRIYNFSTKINFCGENKREKLLLCHKMHRENSDLEA